MTRSVHGETVAQHTTRCSVLQQQVVELSLRDRALSSAHRSNDDDDKEGEEDGSKIASLSCCLRFFDNFASD